MRLRHWTIGTFLMACLLLSISGTSVVTADVPQSSPKNPSADSAVEAQLAEALTYYYQEDYQRALTLFKIVAEQMDNLDISFWIATCAVQEQEYDLAVRHYRKMLSQNPELHRVRLDLADALIKSGDTDAAMIELDIVKKTSPPKPVLDKIENRVKILERTSNRFKVAALMTQGLQFDDNISSGPSSIYIDDALFPIMLDERNRKVSGKNWLTSFSLNTSYDPGHPKEFMWNSGISLYNSHNLDDYPEYNYLTVDIFTGPCWMTGRNVIKVPVGFNDKYYGNERLSNSLHMDPSIEHFLSPRFSILGIYSFANEKFAPPPYHSSDHQQHRFSVGPNYYVDKQKHMASGYFSYEKHGADSDYLTYDAVGLTLSYLFTFQTGTEAKMIYNWIQRRYEKETPLYDEARRDQRSIITFALNQRFMRYLFASIEFSSIDNRSNADLFRYRKNLFAMNVGFIY